MASFLAYGSSTTQGHCDSRGGWPVRLQGELRSHGYQYAEVINHGFRHSLAPGILDKLPVDVDRFHEPLRSLRLPPKKAIGIFQFASDSGFKEGRTEFTPPSEFIATITKIGDFCLSELQTPPVFLTMPPLLDGLIDTRRVAGYNPDGRAQYNQLVRDVALKEGYELVDVEACFNQHLETNSPTSVFAEDGFHPDEAGHELIKQAVLPTALRLLVEYTPK